MGERWSVGSLKKEVCLGMTDRVELVEWICSVFRKWSGGSVKGLLGLGTVIAEVKNVSLPIRAEQIEDGLKIVGLSPSRFGDSIAALSSGRDIKRMRFCIHRIRWVNNFCRVV